MRLETAKYLYDVQSAAGALLARIDHHRQIIAFRNVLIHGYAEVDDALVWDVVQPRLEPLRQQVDALLAGH